MSQGGHDTISSPMETDDPGGGNARAEQKSLTYTNTYVIDEVQKKKTSIHKCQAPSTFYFHVPHLLAKKVRYITLHIFHADPLGLEGISQRQKAALRSDNIALHCMPFDKVKKEQTRPRERERCQLGRERKELTGDH